MILQSGWDSVEEQAFINTSVGRTDHKEPIDCGQTLVAVLIRPAQATVLLSSALCVSCWESATWTTWHCLCQTGQALVVCVYAYHWHGSWGYTHR